MSDTMRVQLHNELRLFYPNVYFQPPSNFRMEYPCIVYSKSRDNTHYADNDIYKNRDAYNITLIEKNPDSTVAKSMRDHFRYCSIQAYFIKDNLHQTTLTLNY